MCRPHCCFSLIYVVIVKVPEIRRLQKRTPSPCPLDHTFSQHWRRDVNHLSGGKLTLCSSRSDEMCLHLFTNTSSFCSRIGTNVYLFRTKPPQYNHGKVYVKWSWFHANHWPSAVRMLSSNTSKAHLCKSTSQHVAWNQFEESSASKCVLVFRFCSLCVV